MPRIGHFPTHMGGDFVDLVHAAKSFNCKSSGFTEMDPGHSSRIKALQAAFGPRVTICTDHGGGLGFHSQEVPIAARHRGLPFRGQRTIKIAEMVDHGVGNDRYLTEAIYASRLPRSRRRFVHGATHLMAAIQNHDSGTMLKTDRVEATARSVERIEERINHRVRAGYGYVLTMDANWAIPRHGHTGWDYSPIAIAARHDMGYVQRGLDWVLWTRDHFTLADSQIIPVGTGENQFSDHPWIVVDLNWKPRFLRRR